MAKRGTNPYRYRYQRGQRGRDVAAPRLLLSLPRLLFGYAWLRSHIGRGTYRGGLHKLADKASIKLGTLHQLVSDLQAVGCAKLELVAGLLQVTLLDHRQYIRMPIRLLADVRAADDEDATWSAVAVWAAVRMHTRGDDETRTYVAYPSIETVARMIDRAWDTVWRVKRWLRLRGWLHTRRRYRTVDGVRRRLSDNIFLHGDLRPPVGTGSGTDPPGPAPMVADTRKKVAAAPAREESPQDRYVKWRAEVLAEKAAGKR